jgi:hypothetical protein
MVLKPKGVFYSDRNKRYWMVFLIIFVIMFFIWPEHVYINLNTEDNTCSLFVYVGSIKGTYEETNTDYTL